MFEHSSSVSDRVVFARKSVQSSGAIFSQADAGEKITLDVATVSFVKWSSNGAKADNILEPLRKGQYLNLSYAICNCIELFERHILHWLLKLG